jgi:chemotaxis protein methyltransferase CheR
MEVESLSLLTQIIETHTGLKIREQDHRSLHQFVEGRIKTIGLKNICQYCDLLSLGDGPGAQQKSISFVSAAAEWKALLDKVTTGESYFWRDHGQIKVLREQILPQLIEVKRTAVLQGQASQLSLRIWSAGCSTGEEAYTLAILLRELLPDFSQWNILILGTDLNPVAIAKAKQGIYKQWSFRQTPANFRSEHFQKVTDGWQVISRIRTLPTFQVGNLRQDPFPLRATHLFDMDLILCRNVFIYFPFEVIANILEKFYATLRPGGYLICGHAELQAQDLSAFQMISFPESMVYQRLTTENQDSAQVLMQQSSPRLSPQLAQIGTQASPAVRPALLAMLPLPVPSQISAAETAIQASPADILVADQTLTSFCERAHTHANQGQYLQAISCCQAALEIDSQALPPLYLLAQIAEEQGDVQQAKTLLKKIIYLHPEDVVAYIELGELYINQQHLPQAIKTLRSAQLLLQSKSLETELEYRGNVTVRVLIQYIEQLLRKIS